MKSSTFWRSLVGVIEPTLMSQRPFQLPAVMTSQAGASQAMSTPSRLAISVATSMSKPSYSPVFSSSDDCGGYAGSVETVSVPLSQTSASRSSDASVVAQTLSPVAAGSCRGVVASAAVVAPAAREEQGEQGSGGGQGLRTSSELAA